MADENTEHSGISSTSSSSPQQNEDVEGFGGNVGTGFATVDSNTRFPGQQFPMYQSRPFQTVEGSLFPRREWPQLPANSGIQPNDQAISGSRGRGLAQASNASVGPSLKRRATQPASINDRPSQRRTTTPPSVPATPQAGPSVAHPNQDAPVLPQAQTAASFPSFAQTLEFPWTLSTADGPLPYNLLHTLFSTPVHPPSPFQIPYVPPQSQNAASLPSMPQTVGSSSHLAKEKAAVQTGRSCSNFAKEKAVGSSSQLANKKSPLRISQVSKGSRPAQTSNALIGPSPKTSATQTPSLSALSASRRATNRPSVPASAQAAPSAIYPPQTALVQPQVQTLSWPYGVQFPVQTADPLQDQIAAYCPSIPPTVDLLKTLSQTPAFPSQVQTNHPRSDLAKETPAVGITPDLTRARPQTGLMCFFCAGDLSFTTEGSITVFQCDHSYHNECLLRIALADQSDNGLCPVCRRRTY